MQVTSWLPSYIFHSSSLGRASWTKHVRNGKELPEIARNDHYDPNVQVFKGTAPRKQYRNFACRLPNFHVILPNPHSCQMY